MYRILEQEGASRERREQAVVGGLGGEAAQGAQIHVNGGGSQTFLVQACPVGLEQGLREGSALFLLMPGQKVIDGPAVGAFGVGRRDAVDDPIT